MLAIRTLGLAWLEGRYERDPKRRGADRIRVGRGGRVEQDRDVVGAVVRDREVGLRVAVEVADRGGEGVCASGEVGRPAEAPATVPEQDRDVLGGNVRDREVGARVGVEVADCDRAGRL